jgi:hypothetical protein
MDSRSWVSIRLTRMEARGHCRERIHLCAADVEVMSSGARAELFEGAESAAAERASEVMTQPFVAQHRLDGGRKQRGFELRKVNAACGSASASGSPFRLLSLCERAIQRGEIVVLG